MFDGKYLEWNQKRIKGIIDFYGHKFIYFKKILDLGCGQADISAAMFRLGADVLALDAREEHLKIAGKKFPGLKTIKADLDRGWPFPNNRHFDMILDLGLLCHVRDYEAHLKTICGATTHLVLETAVCDSDDPNKCIISTENKNIYDLSANGVSSRPTAAAIERVLTDAGMNFKRMDNAKFNASGYTYDWVVQNTDDTSLTKRRIWFAVKKTSPIQIAQPKPPTPPLAPSYPPPPPSFFQTNSSKPVPLAASASSSTQPAIISAAPPEVARYQRTRIAHGVAPYNEGDKKFVIVIPSYKNEQWCVQNINSAINQNYDKYRIIFTDDCSPDGTFDKVTEAVNASGKANKITLVKNTTRIGALANLYNMIHSCDDDEIILTLDGDDWFPHENVLKRLNEIYSHRDVWMTYGQYKNYPDGGVGVAQPYPPQVVSHNSFRSHTWSASHLRTFYAWLFKKIRREDLMQNGAFFTMTWDFAIMFPMLEMAGDHSQFLPDILYTYNLTNPINDHKVNQALQHSLDRHIRGMPKYNKIDKPPPPQTSIGLLLIATNKYSRFLQGMISSADKYFMNGPYNVTYYVFSDQQNLLRSNREIIQIPIDHRPFPFASMDRFKHFTNNADKLSKEDYLYYVDVDCLFVDNVSSEILGNLTGVRHCGYMNSQGPFETNRNSCLYLEPSNYKFYFGGGFSGGKRQNYLELSQWCSTMIDKDVANGVIPVWHDETALNRYFATTPPDVVLTPSYHYPQSNVSFYKKMWVPNDYPPKIILLDKNHGEVRT